jgi:serine/threonine protein kinase
MSGIWQGQHQLDDDRLDQYGVADHDRHATLRHDDVARAGKASRPLDFPAPKVFRGGLVELRARDHKSGTIHHLKNVLLRSNSTCNNNKSSTDTAYLITKKLARTVYGSVRVCLVLKRINRTPNKKIKPEEEEEDRQDHDIDCSSVEWESTDLQAAVKISEWKKVHALRGKHLEDPIKEIAALQLLGNYHPHVAGPLEVLQDDNCLYTVMPYLNGGDLYGRLIEFMGYRSVRSTAANSSNGTTGFDESSARIWFRQILLAVDLLQKKGVCHRDICLENLLLDEDDKVCLIDPGISLRVPYTNSETGGIGDVSGGTSRRLMIAQGQGGKLMYAAPEIISKEVSVDAFATDLWSVGVVLFVMLVGLAPFKWAHPTDKRFANISMGGLKNVIKALDISISPEACDLLQGFFWGNPNKRLTLAEVMHHPWVQGKEIIRQSLTLPNQSSSSKHSKGYSIGSLDLKKKLIKGGSKKSPPKTYGHIRGNSQSNPSELNNHLHLLSSSH